MVNPVARRAGCKLGPLYAGHPDQAELLLSALAGLVPAGEPLYLDVPEANEAAVDLASRHGMQKSFETARTDAGPEPRLPWQRIVGITSFAIG